MTKKRTKRPNLPQEALERARAEMRGDFAETPIAAVNTNNVSAVRPKSKTTASMSGVISRRMPTTEELHAEYDHVMRDLRNLFIVSGVLMVGIIIAALALPALLG